MTTSNRISTAYQVSDDRQKVFDLLPIPRPKIRAMSSPAAKEADMGPLLVQVGDNPSPSIPWSDLPCLWCDRTPTHPYQIDVFTLCHCTWQCASKTLLWLRSVEDERTLRESLGLSDDVELDLKPEEQVEPRDDRALAETLVKLIADGKLHVDTANLKFNADGTPSLPRGPKPGDVIDHQGERYVVVKDEGNGNVTVHPVDKRVEALRERQMKGMRPSQLIMDEAAEAIPGFQVDSARVYEAGSDRPVNVVFESETDALKDAARAASRERQARAARQLRRDRRAF